MSSRYSDLRASSERILAGADSELRKEIQRLLKAKSKPKWSKSTAEHLRRLVAVSPLISEGVAAKFPDFVEESIIQRVGRPVFAITGGKVKIKLEDQAAQVWKRRLEQSAPVLLPAIAAVGRVELGNHPLAMDFVGTGWLIEPDVIVTNRHVAMEFAQRSAAGFGFRVGFDRRTNITVDIDFLEEVGSKAENEVKVREILFISNDAGPDVAFLKLTSPAGRPLPRPIKLATSVPDQQIMVATIGYPAKDSRVPDQALMNQIFEGVFDRKRLAPGLVTGRQPGTIPHDCSTLGGNSGSAVIDLQSGEAVGLHFAGLFLKTNYAVPAPTLAQLLREARERVYPVTGAPAVPAMRRAVARPDSRVMAAPQVEAAQGVTTITIPIEVSVRVGSTVAGQGLAVTGPNFASRPPGPPSPFGSSSPEQVEAAVNLARGMFAQRADVVGVEAGYRFSNGWITDERAVVIYVQRKRTPENLVARGYAELPTEILGVPTDIAPAPAMLQMPGDQQVTEAAAKSWVSNYQPRPDLPLELVQARMKVTLHASPDAGWPVLKAFLSKTRRRLTVGMYDFTAPHILASVKAATRAAGRALSIVIQAGESLNDGTKKDDVPDEQSISELGDLLGNRLSFAWASVSGPERLFDSAYHIKVAVRDGKAFWLSSGNWQSSNQPENDPIADGDESPPMLRRYNREWHAVVEHQALADIFEKHLKRDLEEAEALQEARAVPTGVDLWVPVEYFQPTEAELEAPVRYFRPLSLDREVRVQPLLTPDNYAGHVRDLIQSADERVYFQNQSLSILANNDPAYRDLLQALLRKQRDGLDVRIIFRRFGDMRKNVTALKDFGFDMSRVRLQTNCHTKGIVIDGKAVLLGSHNWTNAGTVFNRDASLIFHDQQIARYFEEYFLYDWNRIGPARVDESLPAVELVTGLEGAPRAGMVRVPAFSWFGE